MKINVEVLMKTDIYEFTADRISDVIDFELRLREEENFYGWAIDTKEFGSIYRKYAEMYLRIF